MPIKEGIEQMVAGYDIDTKKRMLEARSKKIHEWQDYIVQLYLNNLELYIIEHIKNKWVKKFVLRNFHIETDYQSVSVYKYGECIGNKKFEYYKENV